MAGVTRVLVTNALHVLPYCDRVVVLGTGGVVRAIGSLEEIRAAHPGLIESLSADVAQAPSASPLPSPSPSPVPPEIEVGAGAVSSPPVPVTLSASTPAAAAAVAVPATSSRRDSETRPATSTSNRAHLDLGATRKLAQLQLGTTVRDVAPAKGGAAPAAGPAAASADSSKIMNEEERATGSVRGACVCVCVCS